MMLGGWEILIISVILLLCLGVIAGLIILGIWLYQRGSGQGGRIIEGQAREGGGDPMEILRRRYAQGEISKEEFEQYRQDLQEEDI